MTAVALGILMLASGALMILPVDATYLNDFGSDTIEFRTASCGAPLASLLGADPDLHGGLDSRIGQDTAATACEATSAKRAIVALVLLLAAVATWGNAHRRGDPLAGEPSDRQRFAPAGGLP